MNHVQKVKDHDHARSAAEDARETRVVHVAYFSHDLFHFSFSVLLKVIPFPSFFFVEDLFLLFDPIVKECSLCVLVCLCFCQ